MVEEILSKLNDINLEKIINPVKNRTWFSKNIGTEYYTLLSYFSLLYENNTLYDIGSYEGNSAIALGYSNKTKVISYDINNLLNLNYRC